MHVGANDRNLPVIREVPVIRLSGVVPGVPGPGWGKGGTFHPQHPGAAFLRGV